MNYPIIEVEWVDATSTADWTNVKELEVHNCKTCGYLVSETSDFLGIASAVSGDQANAVICVP